MTREVLKQALAVLRGCADHPDADDAVAAIEFELAQTTIAQEPVGYFIKSGTYQQVDAVHKHDDDVFPLYAAAPQGEVK